MPLFKLFAEGSSGECYKVLIGYSMRGLKKLHKELSNANLDIKFTIKDDKNHIVWPTENKSKYQSRFRKG